MLAHDTLDTGSCMFRSERDDKIHIRQSDAGMHNVRTRDAPRQIGRSHAPLHTVTGSRGTEAESNCCTCSCKPLQTRRQLTPHRQGPSSSHQGHLHPGQRLHDKPSLPPHHIDSNAACAPAFSAPSPSLALLRQGGHDLTKLTFSTEPCYKLGKALR